MPIPVLFIVYDFFYTLLHGFLHIRAVYPLIHKHHHRQHFPTRGYLDAGNEHPIEHVVGVTCTWAAVLAAALFPPAGPATAALAQLFLHMEWVLPACL